MAFASEIKTYFPVLKGERPAPYKASGPETALGEVI
jgi:hypothetical protein